ncbi:MAG: thymidine phosphorylase [Candidatus Krumholzibacteriia bacterium]
MNPSPRGLDVLSIIEAKKRGDELPDASIAALVAGYTDGSVPDYQMAAWLMAVWFQGMTASETAALTDAMLGSGEQLDTRDLGGPTADKHSTGGVGDKVSLLLAPLAAACGLRVPMLSGRGLGHTGGTLDKLESVPGYRIRLDNDEFLDIVRRTGCAIVGQSGGIAPADGRIYALRDVTGTVDCVPLITASIMSKKLAAGPETIVIDLKTGGGAFMRDLASARELARSLVATGERWGRRMAVIFSDMDQPLGRAVGHALEAHEAFAALRPGGRASAPADLVELTDELTAAMVATAGVAPDQNAALALVRQAWESGAAFDAMLRWVAAQGGRLDPDRDDLGLEIAPVRHEAVAAASGWVQRMDCRALGEALVEVRGARRRVEDRLDLATGLSVLVRVGERVEAGQSLVRVHARDAQSAAAAGRRAAAAITVGPEAAGARPLIIDRLP